MGAKQSKKSVDITTTPKKGEGDSPMDGEGKVEKIADPDEKITSNGTAPHTEIEFADKENGDNKDEKEDADKSEEQVVIKVNGVPEPTTPSEPKTPDTENGEQMNDTTTTEQSTEKSGDEAKSSDEKSAEDTEKEKKKKDKKKKWSFRSISFSKKDKSKPSKDAEKNGDVKEEDEICVIFGVAGACRNNELVNLKVDDIEDKDTVLIVHIRHTKTNKPRVFVVTSEFEGHVKPIELYKKYAKLRPAQTKHDTFFITYRKSKCTVQPVGIHTFGNIPCKIANYLNLPNPSEYTGHCFRRSSATLFANAGGSKENLKRHGGWKSDTVAESYVEESILNKTKIAKTILGGDQIAHRFDINDNTATTLHQNENIHFPQNFSVDGSTSGINLNNATGCTINFHIYNK